MANHKSAVKQHRQTVKARERNRFHRARLRTQVKKYRAAVAAGDLDAAREMLTGTLSLIDRSAKHGAITGNAADRTKSRLTRALSVAATA
jgi:small subunit ribosomal protein S20